jgi:hypothetical protein
VSQRRFVLVLTLAGSSVRWPGNWLEASDEAVGTETAGPRAWTAWRLLGANNRELARSYTAYPDVDSCRRAVSLLQEAHSLLDLDVRPRLPTGRWYWVAGVDGVCLAVSARWFRWRRDCERNLEQFVIAAPDSIVDFSPRGRVDVPRTRRPPTTIVVPSSADLQLNGAGDLVSD